MGMKKKMEWKIGGFKKLAMLWETDFEYRLYYNGYAAFMFLAKKEPKLRIVAQKPPFVNHTM